MVLRIKKDHLKIISCKVDKIPLLRTILGHNSANYVRVVQFLFSAQSPMFYISTNFTKLSFIVIRL